MPTHTILPQSCTSLGGQAYTVCLPAKSFCEPQTDGDGSVPGNATLVAPIGEHWNCNTCQADEKYSIPYKSGEVIHIQTRFYDSFNADRTDPVSGFGDFIEAVVTDGVTRINVTGMVAYGCKGSFQVTVIDTAAIALDCWVVEFTVYNADTTVRRTAQSQEYAKVSDAECKNTVLVKGEGRGTDCFGNCYETPDAYVGDLVEYDNSTRFWGSIHDTGDAFEKGDTSGDYFDTEVTTPYRLALHRKIPPFAKNALIRQLLAAPRVTIDGDVYDIDSFSLDNQVKRGRMFLFTVELERRCRGIGC